MKNETTMTATVVGKKGGKVSLFGYFLDTHMALIVSVLLFGLMIMSIASASSADTLWTTIADLIKTWVTRLGGVVMFVGGVMFGLGWKSDDAEQKSRGISTLIAGAIVVAIAALTSTFFA